MSIMSIKLFSPTKDILDASIMEDIIQSDLHPECYLNIISNIRGLSKKFDGINPESHIAYWSHDTLASLTKELGFKYYLPLYLGSTTANPFINIEVFDTTEPNISIYGEFIE